MIHMAVVLTRCSITFLVGKVPTEAVLWQAGKILAEKMLDITGRRPSAVYKEPAIQGLFMRMLSPLIK